MNKRQSNEMQSIRKKLLAAIAMLLIACIMTVSSTYAWFTLSTAPEVKGITTLTRALRNFKAGDSTTITIIRSGGQMELEITLDEKPQAAEPTAPTMPESTEGMPSVGDPNEWFDFYSRFFGNQFGD